MTGDYRVTLAVGAVLVAGSPFKVPCQQPRPSEQDTTLDLNGGHGFVGEAFTAVVTVNDQFGQQFLERAKLAANVVDIDSEAQSILFPASVTQLGSGKYEVLSCLAFCGSPASQGFGAGYRRFNVTNMQEVKVAGGSSACPAISIRVNRLARL